MTSEIVRLLEEEVFTRRGYPRVIIRDNGSQFTSGHWTTGCRYWQIRTWTTTPYTPWENPTERRNQELGIFISYHEENSASRSQFSPIKNNVDARTKAKGLSYAIVHEPQIIPQHAVVMSSDEAHFHLNVIGRRQTLKNSKPLHCKRVTVWCGIS
jgi:transposase InsO family protein